MTGIGAEKLPAPKDGHRWMKHGLWIALNGRKIDGRSKLGKAMAMLRGELVKHVGGEPSIIEAILIERITAKTIKCHLYETGVLSDPASSQGSRDHYLAMANSLRLDCGLLGLKPKAANKVLDLQTYIAMKEREKERAKEGSDE